MIGIENEKGMRPVEAADYIQLSWLVTEIAWRIDHGRADTVYELFTEKGEMSLGQNALKGHDQIRECGRQRVLATYHTRHVCTNMRFFIGDYGTVMGTTLLTVYMSQGDKPVIALPRSIGEDWDRFVRTKEKGWRFASREYHEVFASQQ